MPFFEMIEPLLGSLGNSISIYDNIVQRFATN